MFTVAYRNQVSAAILGWAKTDRRIVAAATVGSLAHDRGDRWSDLDLTFAVESATTMPVVLADWTERLVREFGAFELFDLPSGSSIYRVFLLPGCLQFDLSFTPAADFGAIGPDFQLLFGSSIEKAHIATPAARDLFGYAVHHALRARICIERGRLCQAEYWISAARDYALNLACIHRKLPAQHGRGYDSLPSGVRDFLSEALVMSLDARELLRALECTITLLLKEFSEIEEVPPAIRSEVGKLAAVVI